MNGKMIIFEKLNPTLAFTKMFIFPFIFPSHFCWSFELHSAAYLAGTSTPSLVWYHPLPPHHHPPLPLWHHFHSCEWLQTTPSWWRRFLSRQQLSLTSDGQHHNSNYDNCHHYSHQQTGSLDMTTMNNHPRIGIKGWVGWGSRCVITSQDPDMSLFFSLLTIYLQAWLTTMNVHHSKCPPYPRTGMGEATPPPL